MIKFENSNKMGIIDDIKIRDVKARFGSSIQIKMLFEII